MRVKGGPVAKNRRKRVVKQTEGFQGRLKNAFRQAQRALDRALAFNYRDRKDHKREMRQLWITRITAAARARNLSYSRVMAGLKTNEIRLNRKMLADLAATNPNVFDSVVTEAGLSQ